MDNGVIISLILGGASVVSSICFGLIPNIRKKRIEMIEAQRIRLFRDIQLLYNIEEELLGYIVNISPNINKSNLKIKIRDIVSKRYNDDVLSDFSKPSVYKKYIK